eukprot:gene17086-biopygen5315
MEPEVGPACQRRSGTESRSFLAFGWRKRGPGTWVQKKCVLFFLHFDREITYKMRILAVSHFSHFVTGGGKMPGKSGLRAAIRTAARARSGRTNDTDGLWE